MKEADAVAAEPPDDGSGSDGTLDALVEHARSVQHDLNGKVMVIRMNADLILGAATSSETVKRQAGRIKLATDQVERLTRGILNRVRGKEAA